METHLCSVGSLFCGGHLGRMLGSGGHLDMDRSQLPVQAPQAKHTVFASKHNVLLDAPRPSLQYPVPSGTASTSITVFVMSRATFGNKSNF